MSLYGHLIISDAVLVSKLNYHETSKVAILRSVAQVP